MQSIAASKLALEGTVSDAVKDGIFCRADTSLGRDKLQCPASECYGFKIDPGRQKFGNVIWFVSIGLVLMVVFWFLSRCGDIDRQQDFFQISSDEAQTARITTLIIVLLCVGVTYFLLALSKWLVGGTRNSEWWRVWHHGDTRPYSLQTDRTTVNIQTSGDELHSALKNPDVNPSLVESLIRTGAPVNSTNNVGETPLDVAISSGVSDDVLRVLVDAGAVSAQVTKLLNDTLRGKPSPERIKLLIDAGASVNSIDEFSYTTLDHFLSDEVDLESLRVLVDAGASASTPPTILHTYLWTKNPCPAGIEFLVGAGAHANIRDETGDLPD